MYNIDRLQILPLVLLLLCACGDSGDDESAGPDPEPPPPQRGDLIGAAPTLVASYTPDELLAVATSGDVSLVILEEILTPVCTIDVYRLRIPDGRSGGRR